MKTISAALIVALFFGGCATINYVGSPGESKKDYSQINYLGARNSSHIILTDKKELWREYIHVENDSLFYGLNESNLNSIPLSRVNKIFVKDKPTSLVSGIFIGLGTGLVTGLITYALTNKSSDNSVGVFWLGVLTTPIGFIAGYFISGQMEFIFNEI